MHLTTALSSIRGDVGIIRALPHGQYGGLWVDRIQRFVEGADLPLPERYQRYLCAFTESEKKSLFSSDFVAHLLKGGGGITEFAMKLVEPCSDFLSEFCSPTWKRIFRMTNCQGRSPQYVAFTRGTGAVFLDDKLVEFVATIPSHLKLKGWEKKHILIQCLKGILPDSILNRRKQGFSIPLGAWLRDPLRALVEANLSPRTLYDIGIFNVQTVEQMLKKHELGIRNYETQIWALLVFVIWYRAFFSKH